MTRPAAGGEQRAHQQPSQGDWFHRVASSAAE